MMMMMMMKDYGFRSGNGIKAGGFCTGTNDRERNKKREILVDNDDYYNRINYNNNKNNDNNNCNK